MVYFLYPETSLRCLEEVDYIFFTANSSPRPWLDVRKIAADEPLWYGRDSEDVYDYENSEWHQRHVRFSDEVKDSEGETTTLRPSSSGLGEKAENGSSGSSDDEKVRTDSDASASTPYLPRISRDAGRGR